MLRQRFSRLLLITLFSACRAPAVGHTDAVRLTPLFGPVIGDEVIRGREDANGMVLLVGAATLLHIDLAARRSWRTAIAVAAGEACWGLARMEDGSLWSLK